MIFTLVLAPTNATHAQQDEPTQCQPVTPTGPDDGGSTLQAALLPVAQACQAGFPTKVSGTITITEFTSATVTFETSGPPQCAAGQVLRPYGQRVVRNCYYALRVVSAQAEWHDPELCNENYTASGPPWITTPAGTLQIDDDGQDYVGFGGSGDWFVMVNFDEGEMPRTNKCAAYAPTTFPLSEATTLGLVPSGATAAQFTEQPDGRAVHLQFSYCQSNSADDGQMHIASFAASSTCAHIVLDTPDPPQLSPLAPTGSTITARVTGDDGNALEGVQVEIKACTRIGTAQTDGHTHDGRTDECDQSRPAAKLLCDGCKSVNAGTDNPITATTDSDGVVSLTYLPPVSLDSSSLDYHGISGVDDIIATVTINKQVYTDKKTITTKVDGLVPMPGSGADTCEQATHIYKLVKTTNNGCQFYGTPATTGALARIAQSFVDRQIACRDKPGSQACLLPNQLAQGGPGQVEIKGEPVQMRITAMSLPWGGLFDIGPPDGEFWEPPHKTHNNGKMADVNFTDGPTFLANWPSARVLLLREVINGDSNCKDLPVPSEGGDMTQPTNHFHVKCLE
ncbi:MAG: hypothetical protein JOZ93_16740 [Sinobacteraceae bacterium]|nr:hypothetical protein [Nevskiaceae bacterium]